MADFGLPKFYGSGCRQPLTSRVVTLWHRPPELLLGSTDYTAAVDLWSVGCVFSELLLRKPILQGRTEVEQLHKIFKLRGSPPDDYWKKARLPHATIFKPQQPYDSSLRDTFKDLPVTAVNLIETLLSVEPYKRDTASSALASEDVAAQAQSYLEINGNHVHKSKQRNAMISEGVTKPSTDAVEEAAHIKHASQGDIPFTGPLQVSRSSGFSWVKRRKDDASIISHSRSISRGHLYNSFEHSAQLHTQNHCDSKRNENGDVIYGGRADSKGHDSYEAAKRAMQKKWSQFEHPDSLDTSDRCHS